MVDKHVGFDDTRYKMPVPDAGTTELEILELPECYI
jgi:hypothetical protein